MTTTTQELLTALDGVDLRNSTSDKLSQWQTGTAKKAGVRLWASSAQGKNVLVRTTGGTKSEAKKAARLAVLALTGKRAGGTDELWLNTLHPEGVTVWADCKAVAVEVG